MDAAIRAEAMMREGRLEEAGALLEEALHAGDQHGAALARLYRMMGILAASEGDDERAFRHFRVALTLEPSEETPSELNPRQQELFAALRAGRGAEALTMAASIVQRDRDGIEIEVTLAGAPEGLVHGLRVGAGSFSERLDGPGRIAVPSDAADETGLTLTLVAEDEYGNQLVTVERRLGLPAPSTVAADGDSDDSLWSSSGFWITVGSVLAVAAGATVIAVYMTQPDPGFEGPEIQWSMP